MLYMKFHDLVLFLMIELLHAQLSTGVRILCKWKAQMERCDETGLGKDGNEKLQVESVNGEDQAGQLILLI